MAMILALITVLLVLTSVWLLSLFLLHVPEPYMDELFHARQTRLYCDGRFGAWDPKITTPPGLYLVGAAVSSLLRLVSQAGSTDGLSGTWTETQLLTVFRGVNAAFNVASFLVLYMTFRSFKMPPQEAVIQAFSVVLYPMVFFFGFLYYTDAGGLFLILLMHYFSRSGKHALAATCGGLSIFFRQTNIIWVAYALGTTIVADMDLQRRKFLKKDERGTDEASWRLPPYADADLSPQLIAHFVYYLCTSAMRLLRQFWPYGVPLVGFLVYLAWNEGSIVLGDKSHHTAVFHFAQLAYYALIAALVHDPFFFVVSPTTASKNFAASVRWLGRGMACALAVGGAYLLDRFTLSHPFLLADNRHYTFYLWRRLLGRVPHANVWFLPIYAASAWSILSKVRQGSSTLTAGILLMATSLVLLPAHLLELRYHTIPVVMAILEAVPRTQRTVVLSILAYVVVNAITMYIFLYRPYTWADGTTARFMW